MDWLKEILKNTGDKPYDEKMTEELCREITEKIGEGFVPKADYTSLKEELTALSSEKSTDVNKYLNEIEGLKAQVMKGEEELDLAMRESEDTTGALKERHEKELSALSGEIERNRLDFEVEKAILKSGGRNARAIKALIDVEKIAFDEGGKVTGFSIEDIKKSDPYLFDMEETKTLGTGTGVAGSEGRDSILKQFEKALFK